MTAKGKGRRWYGALAVLFVTALALLGVRAYSHVRHEQRFCAEGCHVPKDGSAGWHTAGHDAVACQTCHTTPLKTAVPLLWKKATGQKDLPAHGKAVASECIHCHDKNPVGWRQIEATEGHRTHRGVKDVDCFSCHGDNAHTRDPQSEKTCLKCHEPARLHKITLDAESCLSCHAFTPGAKRVDKPRAMACGGCHADATKVSATSTKVVDDQKVHGGLDCKLCHEPHGKMPAPNSGKQMCARCHQIEIPAAVAGKPEPKGHQDCAGCHEPHAQRKHALDSCVKCHETRVRGMAPVKGLPFANKTTTSALRHESCASCHLPHSWAAEKNGCVTCHKDQAASIQTKSPAAHNDCAQCHDVHGPPPTTLVCMKCHGPTKQNHLAAAPGRHKDCIACHEPHSATRTAARDSCAGCHVTALAQVGRDGPKEHMKGSCFGCHKPHDNPRPTADLCAQCHTDKSKLVAAAPPAKHRACASCHKEHTFAIKDVAATCDNCHGPVIQAKGPHGGECKSCHTLHGNPEVPKTACWQCHKPIQAAFKPPAGAGNAAHDKCRSCHEPHRPAAQAATQCATCHKRQITVAASWPAGSAHVGACQGCHQPHDVKNRKQCSDCHAQEAQSALGGKHQCAQCHAPHREAPGKGPAWWSTCQDCHGNQASGAKARGPVHAECKNCHQPHKFEVPSCATCHASVKQKSLHAAKGHSDKCNACHDPHVKSEPSRAQCLSCHTNKQKHEPEAQKCQACHPFR